MTDLLAGLTDLSATVTPTVSINSMDLLPTVQPKLKRTVVDTRLHLPDMFELTFEDTDNSVIEELMVRIGSLVEIYGGSSGTPQAECLIKGEVTSIEGEYHGLTIYTIIRGYEKAHRLQRNSRTRTFVDMKDSDIASKIAREAGFMETDITDTSTTHRHVSQISQTDWDFLRGRAQEIGFETGVAQGKFFFREASSAKPSGGALGAAASAVGDAAASLAGGGPPTLTFQQNLQWFRPRRSAANISSDVEVRVYDYEKAEVVVGSAPLKTGTAKLDDDPDPQALAGSFTGLPFPIPTLPQIPGLPSLGLMPSMTARVVCNRPLDWGSPTSSAVDEMAKGVAEHMASTILEASGQAYGNPGIQAGKKVVIAGVAEEFVGDWIVTAARHEFEDEVGGYSTYFEVSGRHDRTLLGLTSLGSASVRPSTINGNVIGVVTNNNDPDKMGRVKLGFPWLAPFYETDWARVVQVGMGKEWGNLFLPEVGDEVLVGFEFGDTRRPYVIGGLLNGKSEHPLLSSAVKSAGMSAQIVKRGIVSRIGNQLTFEDEIPSPLTPSPPTTGKITLGDADGKLQLTFDVVNGELKIVCDGGVMNPIGSISIEQKSNGGSISVKSAGDVTIEASAPGKLTLKGGTGVSIDGGTANVEIKGTAGVKLDAGAGMMELSGSMVKLN
ncbi:MAG TPA: phage baseplate assembly protein V [Ilumatobacteraceae bacterium]